MLLSLTVTSIKSFEFYGAKQNCMIYKQKTWQKIMGCVMAALYAAKMYDNKWNLNKVRKIQILKLGWIFLVSK